MALPLLHHSRGHDQGANFIRVVCYDRGCDFQAKFAGGVKLRRLRVGQTFTFRMVDPEEVPYFHKGHERQSPFHDRELTLLTDEIGGKAGRVEIRATKRLQHPLS